MSLSLKSVLLAAVICTYVYVVIISHRLSVMLIRRQVQIPEEFRPHLPPPQSLLIMSWNGNWYSRSRQPLQHDCIADNRTYRCAHVSRNDGEFYQASDAVFFYAQKMNLSDLPDSVPRPPGQLWIFHMRESPMRSTSAMLGWSSTLFNVTSTYSMDSDVPSPYVTPCRVRTNQKARSPVDDQNLLESIRNKTRPVAWFVSNCRTPSLREKYVEELRRYIDVDVFGRCGHTKCPKNESADCDRLLITRYKFYLSFENSLCDEYVTEKFTRTLDKDVVSVVLGSSSHSRIAPEDTFIDARNFRSPRHLAEYLKLLDGDHRAYAEFIHRKRTLDCRPSGYGNHFCRLCVHLHKLKESGKSQVRDVRGFWNRETKCQKPEVYYKNMGLKVRT